MTTFTNLLLVVFAIQLTLIVLGIATIPGDTLYEFIKNPSGWDSDAFKTLLSDVFLAVGGVAIIVGSLWFKSDFVVFAGFSAVLFSFGKGLANLHSIISAQISPEVAWFTISPIILIYIMTTIAFWRGRA